jgi:hypothetical protein
MLQHSSASFDKNSEAGWVPRECFHFCISVTQAIHIGCRRYIPFRERSKFVRSRDLLQVAPPCRLDRLPVTNISPSNHSRKLEAGTSLNDCEQLYIALSVSCLSKKVKLDMACSGTYLSAVSTVSSRPSSLSQPAVSL